MQSKLKVAAIHPVIEPLQSARQEAEDILADYIGSARWFADRIAAIDPTKWTGRIEAALDDTEETQKLRLQYREHAITAMTAFLKEDHLWWQRRDVDERFMNAFRAVIAAHDALDDSAANRWVKTILKGVCVTNNPRDLHTLGARLASAEDRLLQTAESLLEDGFNLLVEQLAAGARDEYPTGPAVPEPGTQKLYNKGYSLRHAFVVPLKFREDLSVNAQVYEQAMQIEKLRQEVNEAEKFLRAENGKVNESQHAARLVEALHNRAATCYPYRDARLSVNEQQQRRIQHECARQIFSTALNLYKQQYKSLIALMFDAIKEAKAFAIKTREARRKDRYLTIDLIRDRRIAMNNCLAVDILLRYHGEQVSDAEKVFNDNYSLGLGAEALSKQFDVIAGSYRLITRVHRETSDSPGGTHGDDLTK